MCTKKAHRPKDPQDRISIRISLGTLSLALKLKGWTERRKSFRLLHIMVCQCNFSGEFCISRHLCTPCVFQLHPLKRQMKVCSCSFLFVFSSEPFGLSFLLMPLLVVTLSIAHPCCQRLPFGGEGGKERHPVFPCSTLTCVTSTAHNHGNCRLEQIRNAVISFRMPSASNEGRGLKLFSTRRASQTASLLNQVLPCQG